MKITSIIEREKGGGVVVWYEKDGAGPTPFDLPDDYSSPVADRLREAVKSSKLKTRTFKEFKADAENAQKAKSEKIQAARVGTVNEQLKSIGSKKRIKTLAEIQNAEAFITIRRAEIFAQDEGA